MVYLVKNITFFILMFVGILLFSCTTAPKQDTPLQAYKGIFVLNEGQWTLNNARLDFFDEQQNYTPYLDIFRTVNNTALGDVANSVLIDHDTLYIVMNNSQLLYKIQMPTMKLLGTLQFPVGASLRNMVKVSPHKAYINSMLNNTIYIIDPITLTLQNKKITIENYSESMSIVQDKLIVSCGNYAYPATNNKLAILNINSDEVEQYIEMPIQNPGAIVKINDSKIAVLLRGNFNQIKSGIAFINVNSWAIDTVINLSCSAYDLKYYTQELFFTSDSAISHYNMQTNKLTYNYISRQNLLAKASDLIYGFEKDTITSKYYITNAGQGALNGQLIILNENKEKIAQQTCGIFPKIIFYYR